MNRLLLLRLLALGLSASLLVAAESAADRDYQDYVQYQRTPPPKPFNELTRREQAILLETRAVGLHDRVLAFLEKHPTDPRRWRMVMSLNPLSPRFVTEWGPADAEGSPQPTIDPAAAAAWQARVAALNAAFATASDVPPDLREQWVMREALKPFTAAYMPARGAPPADYAALRARLDAHVKEYPKSSMARNMIFQYMAAFERDFPREVVAEWQSFMHHPHEAVSGMAKDKVRFHTLLESPIDIAFTAADGRVVDTKKLRGRVVLIDFWATWCGPCIAELPNVKKVYAEYHGKGFEVIGISLENARLLDTDTEEMKAQKHTAARKVLLDFAAKSDLPWPQHYDGKYWKNDISSLYAVTAVPAMFLLDPSGRVISTHARGAELERQVKRLLASP